MQLQQTQQLQKEVGTSSKSNLEIKIKMLNEVGVMKKRSPMQQIGNYFSNSEEVKEYDSFPVSIWVVTKNEESSSSSGVETRQALFKEDQGGSTLFLQYEASEDGLSGYLIVARDPLFFKVLVKFDTKSIVKVTPSTSECKLKP